MQNKVDLDSMLSMVTPESLKQLIGIRCFLGSTRYRPHGDPILKNMTLLVNYPIQVYVEKDEKEVICEELKKKGVIFEKSIPIDFIAKKQVSISTGVLVKTLIDCKIEKVRVVVHDLKDPFFGEYFNKITIIPHETNRFDFGEYVVSPYKIFQKEHTCD